MSDTTLIQQIRRQEKESPGATGELTSLMTELSVAVKLISREVNHAGIGEDILGLTGEINVQGEEVQKLDRYANDTLIKLMSDSGAVCAIASEEDEYAIIVPPQNRGKYIFMMDPLDGSSNIDVNVSIGTIFSVYRKVSSGNNVETKDLLQQADQQVAAGYIIYGTSTMFVYTVGRGVHGFTLDPSIGEFFLTHPNLIIPEQGTIYSINEGTQSLWNDKQKGLIKFFKEPDKKSGQPYKLRYVGTFVSDFHRTLLKGGLFMYPDDKKNPQGKLRFLFEAAPMAFIAKQAGGKASDGINDILSLVPNEIHQRTPLFIGSSKDVDIAVSYLK